MHRWLGFLCSGVLICVMPVSCGAVHSPAVVQVQTEQAPPDGVALLLNRLEKILTSGTPADFNSLISAVAVAEPLRQVGAELFVPETTRAVVRERDRAALPGTLPGDGFRLVVEIFTESATRGRIITARMDVRRPRGSEDPADWRIAGAERLTTVEGLHRLSLDTEQQFTARNLAIRAEDLELRLESGSVFTVQSADGITGLVLIGRGEMVFSPTPETERGQVRIFAGSESLAASFDSAFVRLNPFEYDMRVTTDSLSPSTVDARQLRRARELFEAEAPKSFSLDLTDLSRDTWYLLPAIGDFLAEVRTRRHGTLTYARSTAEAEDVTLFDRARRRNIALYASPQKLAARGRFYDEDNLTDYDILHYTLDASISPEREFVQGRARMRIRIRAYALATLTIRLADALVVTGLASAEHGRLPHLRVRNQNAIVVNLPTSMPRDAEMTLAMTYSGRLPSQALDREALTFDQQRAEDLPLVLAERNYLLSSRAYWYPQAQVTDFTTATLRISVPPGYACVASGEMAAGSPVAVSEPEFPHDEGLLYVFTAPDPLRYFALVVSRFVRVSDTVVPLADELTPNGGAPSIDAEGRTLPGFRVRDRVRLSVDANPRQQGRGREVTAWTTEILRFYADLIGEAPYPAMALALVEDNLPGGHSPAYMAVLNNPLPTTPFVWRNDPANFSGFPQFFLAHELAHQWWGQAVGWQNYHEQWLSEGFSQYFAALYAQKVHGEDTFVDMLRQFRRWALSESDQGPVYLGYRLGHIKGESRVFRALLYNKGAAVLHMLRRLMGDDAFFNALRRFYRDHKFAKASTNDLRAAVESETGRSFERFFERWIYGSSLPRLRYATQVGDGEVIVRFRQPGDLLFDVPVTVTISYTDGRTTDVVVAVTEAEVEERIAVDGAVRNVQVNRDSAAIAHFDES